LLRGKGKTFVNVFPFPLKLPHPLSKLFKRKRPPLRRGGAA